MNEFLNGRSGWAAQLSAKRRRSAAESIEIKGYGMSTQVTIAKAAAAALAGVIALSAGAQASAQTGGSYTTPSQTGYYYDACKRDQTQRGTLGAVLGGGAGAVIGSNAAARNARTEGALLGGLLGAVLGGVVGNKSAACVSPSTYYGNPPPPPPAASNGGYYERDAYAGSVADRYPAAERAPEPDGCTLAESPIYMPDGRTQSRFVRVCRDATGKYAVVD